MTGAGARLRVFDAHDRAAALVSGLIALAVFVWTAAPNVTLLDSGEFIVAAQHFGVPHPTAYPLWTMGAWLMTLLPLGNAAWEVNLFSALGSALAVAVFAGLGSSLLRWFFGGAGLGPRWAAAISGAMALAGGFSVPVWSQAVIAEVYGLHSLLTGCFVGALYYWARDPARWRGFVLAVFFFALGMSNHHLMLSLGLVLGMAVLLVRTDVCIEVLLFLALVGALVYWLFGLISGELASLDASVRLLLCVLAGLGLWRLCRGRFDLPGLFPRLLAAVVLGLLPYLYLPVASSTNPPMNWGYTRTREGFFYSINRSQYQGTLSNQLLRTAGRVVGSTPPELTAPPAPEPAGAMPEPGRLAAFAAFTTLYWSKLVQSFTPALLVPFLLAFTALRVLDRSQRAVLLIGYLSFFFAAFFQPLFDQAGDDLSGWLLQMPYHGYSFLLFGLLATIGAGRLDGLCAGRLARLRAVRFLWLVLPVFPLLVNLPFCNQRGHWFGWEYGTGMVGSLPRGAVLFGGTDPGRFVPTYMIFGESTQPARHKRDPDFDRRDVYIITQNALVDPFYLRYIWDHYAPSRPAATGWFARRLGRDRAFPEQPLDLPDDAAVRAVIEQEMKSAEKEGRLAEKAGDSSWLNGAVAKAIWERNRGRHSFFVEESFPMEWTYPHAVPRGLIYEIMPDPLPVLPADAVEADMEFWRGLVARYLKDPKFLADIDARRSFSKLRSTSGNLYRHRKMEREAETAYREALALWPASGEALSIVSDMLAAAGRHGEAMELVLAALQIDPRSRPIRQIGGMIQARKTLSVGIEALKRALQEDPANRDAWLELLRSYEITRDDAAADELITAGIDRFAADAIVLQEIINHRVRRLQWPEALAVARRWDALEPANAAVKFTLAKFLHATGATEEFYAAAAEAVRLGGIPMREQIAREPVFAPRRSEARFRELIGGEMPGPPKDPR